MTGYMHRVECDASDDCPCGCVCHRRCGETLRLIGEPCHRLAGHSQEHRSRESVDAKRIAVRR
jgi:hypothetical protein